MTDHHEADRRRFLSTDAQATPAERLARADRMIADLYDKVASVTAARDHLRARLQLQIEQWHESAVGEIENSNPQYAQALGQCAADLLAVLTEQDQEKKDVTRSAETDVIR